MKRIKFKKYGTNRYEPSKYFGFVVDIHPKYKSIDIYFGRYIYVFWIGYKK